MDAGWDFVCVCATLLSLRRTRDPFRSFTGLIGESAIRDLAAALTTCIEGAFRDQRVNHAAATREAELRLNERMSKILIMSVSTYAAPKTRMSKPRKMCVTARLLVSLSILGASPVLLAQPAQPPPPQVSTPPAPATLTNDESQALVRRVLHTELEAAQDLTHPMQYRLHKVSPRLATTKLIVETRDGDVARLEAVNGLPLSPVGQQNEETRLQTLLNDPGLQRHRQEREQSDTERARKIMRALPDAFIYTYAGTAATPQGPSYRLSFQPNPRFNPQDLEAQVLKGMAGELWIDVAQQRVTRLEGKRIRDVDYGWGVLGRLDAGGTLLLEQDDIGNHQWRITHMVLAMNAKLLFKVVKLDTTLEMSQFSPVTSGIGYQEAVRMLLANPAARSSAD
jgi:hypothetical protein